MALYTVTIPKGVAPQSIVDMVLNDLQRVEKFNPHGCEIGKEQGMRPYKVGKWQEMPPYAVRVLIGKDRINFIPDNECMGKFLDEEVKRLTDEKYATGFLRE